jgi:8-amino-7-oxononanoate synthase
LAAGALVALDIAGRESWRREQLRLNRDRLREGLAALGRPIPSALPGHIMPVLIGNAERTIRIGQQLRERGFLVGAVRPPTVPLGGSRLRITVSAAHTPAQIDGLLQGLADVFKAA